MLETLIERNSIVEIIGRLKDPFQPLDVTTRYIIVVLQLVRLSKGQDVLDEMVDTIISNHLPSISDRELLLKHINNEHRFVNVYVNILFVEYGAELLQIDDFYRFVGRSVANPMFLQIAAGESLGMNFIYEQVAKLCPSFTAVLDMEYDHGSSRNGYAVIKRRSKDCYRRRLWDTFGEKLYHEVLRNDCMATKGVLEGAPKVIDFDREFARVVKEPTCEASYGEDICEYHLQWDARPYLDLSAFSVTSPRTIIDAGRHIMRGLNKAVMTKAITRLPASRKLIDRVLQMEVIIQQGREEAHRESEARSQAEQLAAVAQLSFGLGHDLRNILSKVIQSDVPIYRLLQDVQSLLVLYKQGKVDEADKHIEERNLEQRLTNAFGLSRISEDSLADAIGIVTALEGYPTEDGSDFIDMRIEDVLQKVLRDYDERLRGIDVETSYADEPYRFRGNPLKIYRVFSNILLNSIEALENRGDPKITIRTRIDGGKHLTAIEDNGIGIGGEAKKDVFQPFYTTKELQSGRQRGHGLATAYNLVTQHGGKIDIESQPGECTEVVLDFNIAN